MPASNDDHVIVLAGGRGTRMGGPKVLMEIDGSSWWEYQSKRLLDVGLDQTWVVSTMVMSQFVVQADSSWKLVKAQPDAPMFDSLMRGIESLDLDQIRGVFVLPIDVPAPSPPAWRALSATGRCASPVYRGARGHPIYLPTDWIRTRLLPTSAAASPRLDELVRVDRLDVEVDDSCVAANLNTPDDVRRWLDSQGYEPMR